MSDNDITWKSINWLKDFPIFKQLLEHGDITDGYIASMYDNEWYIGTVAERSNLENEVHVKFMNRNNTDNALVLGQTTQVAIMVGFQCRT